MAYDIHTRLTDREAERLKRELSEVGVFPKLHELRKYSPIDIAKRLKRDVEEVAEMAGRMDEPEEGG